MKQYLFTQEQGVVPSPKAPIDEAEYPNWSEYPPFCEVYDHGYAQGYAEGYVAGQMELLEKLHDYVARLTDKAAWLASKGDDSSYIAAVECADELDHLEEAFHLSSDN